jgi:hypothetical protein
LEKIQKRETKMVKELENTHEKVDLLPYFKISKKFIDIY